MADRKEIDGGERDRKPEKKKKERRRKERGAKRAADKQRDKGHSTTVSVQIAVGNLEDWVRQSGVGCDDVPTRLSGHTNLPLSSRLIASHVLVVASRVVRAS
jgi:hypothetical protein